MATAIALAKTTLEHRAFAMARTLIVSGCALALIFADRALPF
jgi:hypothetical protein